MLRQVPIVFSRIFHLSIPPKWLNQQLADNFVTQSQKLKILLGWLLVLLRVLPLLLVNPLIVRLALVPNDQPNRPKTHLYLQPVKHQLRRPTNTFKVQRTWSLPTTNYTPSQTLLEAKATVLGETFLNRFLNFLTVGILCYVKKRLTITPKTTMITLSIATSMP